MLLKVRFKLFEVYRWVAQCNTMFLKPFIMNSKGAQWGTMFLKVRFKLLEDF